MSGAVQEPEKLEEAATGGMTTGGQFFNAHLGNLCSLYQHNNNYDKPNVPGEPQTFIICNLVTELLQLTLSISSQIWNENMIPEIGRTVSTREFEIEISFWRKKYFFFSFPFIIPTLFEKNKNQKK